MQQIIFCPIYSESLNVSKLFMMRFRLLIFFTLISIVTHAAPVDYARDIEPILTRHCLDCHGPDKQKSDLRVDQRASLLRGGDYGLAAIVPGKPGESFLLETVLGQDPDMTMPPKGDPLTGEQIDLLTRWIKEGASWPGQMADKTEEEITSNHWSLQPVKKPGIPKGKETQVNPIDAFIQQGLKHAGLSPSPEADRATLLRRASLAITGLPPTPEEVIAFVEDVRPTDTIFRECVDELLNSDRYGERWAQHWLDVIRYADTTGYEYNRIRPHAWPYRDYVIESFNADKPWDQFIKEQVAGDQLGVDPATGFLVTAPLASPAEVGKEPEQIKQARYNSLDEMVQNIGVSMLGLTVSCARCHNHKFDPISMDDYYGLVAVLEGVQYNDRRWRKESEEERVAQIRTAEQKIADTRAQLEEFPSWRHNAVDRIHEHFPPVMAKYVRMTVFETDDKRNGAAFDEIEIYHTPEGGRPQNVGISSHGAKATSSGAWPQGGADEVLNDGKFGKFGKKSEWISVKRPTPDNWVQIELATPVEVHQVTWSRNRELAKTNPKAHAVRLATDYRIDVAMEPGQWTTVVSRTREEGLTMAGIDRRRYLEETIDKLEKQLPVLQKGPRVFAGSFKKPGPTFFFHRGDPQQPKHQVPPSGLSVIDGFELAPDTPEQNRRLALAEWIASDENPLTARVAVNRIWHHHFGIGLVSTPGDFGTQGERPSHPDLLDWLAAEFMVSGWSVKHLHRLILTSYTWRQSSTPVEAAVKIDPNTRLLWRFPPRRLEAEAIRDSLLYTAGKLDFSMGGPGYNVYQKKPNFGEWKPLPELGPEAYRRMIYMQKMRAADDGMFKVFDVPDCGQVRAKRGDSTTPLQALNLFNGPFVHEQALRLAKRVRSETGEKAGSGELADRLVLTVFSRFPTPEERELIARVIRDDSLVTAARAVMNTNEFLFLN